MSFSMRVECPRCKRVWVLPQGSPGQYCNCHLYCADGDKPGDCTLVNARYSGQLGWPVGLHSHSETGGDDVMHRVTYCTVHNKYNYKTAVWIEADWQKWFSRRAPSHLRMSKGNY